MNIENEQFISIDTNQTIMEEADTLMEEYEQQKIDQLNQRVKELEASNKELLEAMENECHLCRHGNGNSFNPDCPNGKMCLIHGAIQKERGLK